MNPEPAPGADRTPQIIHPLGLPAGSIRAVAALTIVAVTIKLSLEGRPLPLLLSETLLIVLAHYFAVRRAVRLPDPMICKLEAEGVLPSETNPLWLPIRTVRIIILGAFFGTALYLVFRGRLFKSEAFGTIWLVFCYLAGVVFNFLYRPKPAAGAPSRARHLWTHLVGLATLAFCGLIGYLGMTGQLGEAPLVVQKITLAFILFYFGVR